MIIGPDEVITCPSCSAFAKVRTLRSGNTLSAVYWTDGRMFAPMLPRTPSLACCHKCHHVYWLKDAECYDEDSSYHEDEPSEEIRRAYYVREPKEADYYAALAGNIACNAQEERSLRIQAWWKSNDEYRNAESGRPYLVSAIEAREANMESMLPLLDETDDHDVIMKAELLRELGRFDDAVLLLDTIENPRESAEAIQRIRDLCLEQETLVKPLEEEEESDAYDSEWFYKRDLTKKSPPWWRFW